ncbi:hypothetical protein PGH07_04155 [Sulfurovum sp. zt1-1]|uniref:Uncharacterized protein n=1 Tax=Sulfurovum zhangzhouensis TaxID=3019067 RepID=A0ABT7QWZ8_9BACT|nr:hypothetical protein [Sulfurovum zhangzhouensis]MDM5271361.1 hypothetical protein [Sulfurovum zhangzhouensis]
MKRWQFMSLKKFRLVDLQLFVFLLILFVYVTTFTIFTERGSDDIRENKYTKEVLLDDKTLYTFEKNVDLIMDLRFQNISMLFPSLILNHASVTLVSLQVSTIKPYAYMMNIDGVGQE